MVKANSGRFTMNTAVRMLLFLRLVLLIGVCSAAKCGSPVISSRITGGTDAVDGEWPWQVALTYSGVIFCGGSLINEQWVLSAAHCIYDSIPASNYTIYMGISQRYGPYPYGKSSSVETMIKHPQYTTLQGRGDIALIKLSKPITYTDYIQPICLPAASATFPSGMECWVTGWGKQVNGDNLQDPQTLQKVKLPLIDYKQCEQMYNIDSIQDDKICAGYTGEGKDACLDDGGGPLVCKVNGFWIQAGIVSYEECGWSNSPSLYTLAPAYQSWIQMYIPEMTFSAVSIPISPSSLPSPPVCGRPVISGRIVGGTDSVYGEWPWQVAVVYEGDFICGGSLINSQWVMSAAHCFTDDPDKAKYVMYLGIYQVTGSNQHLQRFYVEELILNPQYTYATSIGDIALVKLSSPVTFTDYVQPICLPAASVTFRSGMECWVTGWGNTAYGVVLSDPKTLQKVKVLLIDYIQCNEMYHTGPPVKQVTIKKEMICAGYKEGGKASCQGDSGGPVVCKVNGVWIQAGIVSWAVGCALPNRPGVKTLVPAFQSWIETYIPEQQFVTFSSGTSFTWAPWKNVLFCILLLFRVLCV